jgi:uncharacterized OB-fold protein
MAAAVDGWFTLGDEPRLIGTRCSKSGTYYFPPERTMSRAPGCSDSELVEVELSRTGTVWSYTNAGYQPPEPYIPTTDPFEPFVIAAVSLEAEGIVVLGQCVTGVTTDDITVGTEVELVLDTLYSEGDIDYVMWKWQPLGWTKESAA